MKTVFFAANRSQHRYFRFLTDHFEAGSSVVYARRCWVPSLCALKFLDRSVLAPIVEYKLTELSAKIRPLASWKRILYRRLLMVLAIVAFLRYWRPIVESKAACLAVWNGHFFRQAIARAIAERVDLRCVYFENGLLPGTTTLDHKGVNYANSVPRNPVFFANRPAGSCPSRKLVPRTAKNPSRFATKTESLPSRYVFVPFQIDHDTQITRFSPWIRDMEHFFTVITAAFARAGNVSDLVFKEHPSATKRYPAIYRMIESTPNLHMLNHVSTQRLIENAEAVMVVNSTVGLEALLYGKKVVVLGQAFYGLEGIACHVRTEAQLISAVRQIDRWQVDQVLVDRFLAYLHTDYAISGSWKTPHVQHAAAVEGRLKEYHGQNTRHFHGINPAALV